jgi:hypothetical protein
VIKAWFDWDSFSPLGFSVDFVDWEILPNYNGSLLPFDNSFPA